MAGPYDLNNLKEQIQTILEQANTTTAATDLSSGLETRVQQILKVNPARIPIQAQWFPFVTIYTDSKEVLEQTMQRDQNSGRRKAEFDVKVVGAVWNSTISNENADDADDDCESLMENIEQILRGTTTATNLNSACSWQIPTNVTYHNVSLEEEASVRAGILNLKVIAFY